MGYFSNYTPDSNPTGLFERSVCSYPSRLETLNYYLDDLTSALETVDQNRPHNQLHPEYDRCFYSSGRYRYYEVLWAEQVSVQDLLAAIAEVQELIRNASYDYGHEAINTLVKRLEDSRKDFVCIMAGYTNEMNQMLSSNPGLRDRIQFYIDFPDYSAEELVQIYCKYAESEAYQLGTDAKVTLRQMAEQIIRNKDENFSNARLIRKVFERTRMKQAMRTSDNMISAEDIQAVFAESDMRALLDSVQVQRRIGFVG